MPLPVAGEKENKNKAAWEDIYKLGEKKVNVAELYFIYHANGEVPATRKKTKSTFTAILHVI
jgi:hypothetical protein